MSEQNTQVTAGYRRVLAFETAGKWIPETLREEVELFAAMPPAENEFTPNLVGTANAFTGTLQDFCRLAMAGLETSLSETRFAIELGRWIVAGVRIARKSKSAGEGASGAATGTTAAA